MLSELRANPVTPRGAEEGAVGISIGSVMDILNRTIFLHEHLAAMGASSPILQFPGCLSQKTSHMQ